MNTLRLKTSLIVPNEGQVPGLPTNPRQWKKAEMDKLKKSLEETPELFEARGIIVYPFEGKYIVLGGNMRLAAAKALKMKEVPCIVIPEDTPVDKLKEIVIKDNGSFGEWDYDLLGNEWDDLPLTDWGVPAWNTEANPDEFGDEFSLPDGDKEPFQQMSFMLADAQAAEIKQALEDAKHLEEYKAMITHGNANSNGNALAYIIEQWVASRI